MPNLEDMLRILAPITAFLVAVAALLKAIVEIVKALKELKPSTKYLKYLVIIATQIVPVGVVIWYFMYWAAENSGRLTEPVVFLLLVAESTMLISLYEFIWGVWFYPRLKSLPVKREQNEPQLPLVSQPSTDNKQEPNIESPSSEEYQ